MGLEVLVDPSAAMPAPGQHDGVLDETQLQWEERVASASVLEVREEGCAGAQGIRRVCFTTKPPEG